MGKKQSHKRYAQRAPEHPEKGHTSRSALKSLLMILIPALLVFGAGGFTLFMRDSGGSAKPTPSPMTAASGSSSSGSTDGAAVQTVSLPAYVQGAQMIAAYQFAVNRPDVLDYVPCYCGCGKHSNHKSNKSCFVKPGQTNGKVVFDDHGANCDMCIELAIDAKRLTAEGKSVKDIRQYVEQKYGSKGESTDTPWPEA